MIDIKQLDAAAADFWPQLENLLDWEGVSDEAVTNIVREILAAVKTRGDAAVIEYSQRFDRVKAKNMADLEISLERAKAALESIPHAQREALEAAAERVRIYHEHQKQESWSYTEADGTILGQQVMPLDLSLIHI